MQIAPGNEPQAKFWANVGPIWAAMQDQLDAQVAEHGQSALDVAAAQPGERVLDVGCGTGTTAVQLAAAVAPDGVVVALDLSQTMVDAASARAEAAGASNISFLTAHAQAHAFEADAYDLIFSRFGVMFFADPVAAFANLRSGLRAGRRMVFSCWQGAADNPWVSKPIMAARQHIEFPMGGDPTAPGPLSLTDPERVRSILGEAGYAEVNLQDVRLQVQLGDTLEEAVDFMYTLNPGVAGPRRARPGAGGRDPRLDRRRARGPPRPRGRADRLSDVGGDRRGSVAASAQSIASISALHLVV